MVIKQLMLHNSYPLALFHSLISLSLFTHTYTHTHIHTHIHTYIYIFIYLFLRILFYFQAKVETIQILYLTMYFGSRSREVQGILLETRTVACVAGFNPGEDAFSAGVWDLTNLAS